MPLLTKTQVSSTQYSVNGAPWVKVTAKTGIDTSKLDNSVDGSPWWGVMDATNPIKKVAGVTWSSIKKIAGVVIANIKKIMGVQTT